MILSILKKVEQSGKNKNLGRDKQKGMLIALTLD